MLDSVSCLLTRVGVVLLLGVTGVRAGGTGPFTVQAPVPSADIWMYPHAGSPGTRTTASTFSALPVNGSVDDRFGQFLLKFDTVAAGVPAGLGEANYELGRVVLTCVIYSGDSSSYDPTEDARSTYGPDAAADSDTGRPIEVHGAGFRGGFTASSFDETSAFGSGDPGGRNSFSLGYSPEGVERDVSGNVTADIDSTPWAVARMLVKPAGENEWSELTPGSIIPPYAHAVFELDLSLPGVARYVRNSLNQGFIWLTVSSLHSVTEMAASGYPSFYTKENAEQALFGDVASMLDVEYSLPLRITAFSRDAAGNTQLTWNGSPGFQYVLEAKEDLAAGIWSPIETFTTSAPTPLIWNGTSPLPRAFFRIARSPLP